MATQGGPAMNVVISAISTSAENNAAEITPLSSARLRTINSVSPRVFISVPIAAAGRHPMPVTRAASTAPPNFPTIATATKITVSSHSSGRSSSPTFVRSPV